MHKGSLELLFREIKSRQLLTAFLTYCILMKKYANTNFYLKIKAEILLELYTHM